MQRPIIKMTPRRDRDGAIFYIGDVKWPGTINFEKGVAFIFYPEMEVPELHICTLESPDISSVFDYYSLRKTRSAKSSKSSNLPIELHPRFETNPPIGQKPRKFYIGKIQFNGTIVANDGIIFFAFIQDEGEEELQIAVYNPEKASRKFTPQPQSYIRKEDLPK